MKLAELYDRETEYHAEAEMRAHAFRMKLAGMSADAARAARAPISSDVESDDELRARVRYVAGNDAVTLHHIHEALEAVAERYGLKRRAREPRMTIGIDPGFDPRVAAAFYTYQGKL